MEIFPKPNLQLIYVSDIKRSTDFYKTLFNTEPIFQHPRYVAFAAGDKTTFGLRADGRTPDNTIPRFSEIGIMLSSSQDVDLLFEKWKKNPVIKILHEPRSEAFGRTFLIEDPDGHIIRILG